MEPAHLHLIRHALAAGCELAITRSSEKTSEKTTNYHQLKRASEADETCWLNLFRNNKAIGQALIAHDDPHEDTTVADYTPTPFLVSWWTHYEATQLATA